MVSHPVVELTSEASWGLVSYQCFTFDFLVNWNTADRGQILAIRKGNTC